MSRTETLIGCPYCKENMSLLVIERPQVSECKCGGKFYLSNGEFGFDVTKAEDVTFDDIKNDLYNICRSMPEIEKRAKEMLEELANAS